MYEAVGRAAANEFISSIEENSRRIDMPTIDIAEQSSSWEWLVDSNEKPKWDFNDLAKKSKSLEDPFVLVERDLANFGGGVKELLGSDHPVLESCAKYFFDTDGGKKIRPTMVLAVSYALNSQSTSLVRPQTDSTTDAPSSGSRNAPFLNAIATPSQKRLSEITEMIHTASLFHDDVIDTATTRRVPSVNQVFGNKLAILGGDFLLARASVSLARLRDVSVVEIMSTVIEHLVKGEIMQMKPKTSTSSYDALEYYLRKNYYKTASLMGNSCLSAAILGGHSMEHQRAAYLYGTYVGQAFQLIDDALDFEGTTAQIGKAPLADIKSGLATAPMLYAAVERPELYALIGRKFEGPGDVDLATSLLGTSTGLAKTKILAQVHIEKAIQALDCIEMSPARSALECLACKVLTRVN